MSSETEMDDDLGHSWTRILEYAIDLNGFLILKLSCASDGSGIVGRLYSPFLTDSRLVRNITPLLSLSVVGKSPIFPLPSGEFFMPFFIPQRDRISLRLYLNGSPLTTFEIDPSGKLRLAFGKPPRRLSVMETRMIGRLPHGMQGLYQDRKIGFHGQKPLTDLHTHLSAQISGKDLVELGMKHDIYYPVAALEKLRIEYPNDDLKLIPRRDFLPLAHLNTSTDTNEPAVSLKSLSKESLKALEFSFSLSPEYQSTFEDIEVGYYLREPFTKEKRLFPEILRKVAQSYQKQGILYAELSSNAVLDPEWLKIVHEAMPDIEAETGVQLRFLVGIPRNLDDLSLRDRIARIKKMVISPYIVGVDILGYEMNKTSYLSQHLEHIAQWIQQEHPDLILRIHAGEIQKNSANVKECLELCGRYQIRMRIGHAVYGVDAETKALARDLANMGKVIFEFNPDSNLAGNNIDFPSEVPIAEFTAKRIPSVLASDGASLYLTDALQTALAGGLCGLTESGSRFIEGVERQHIAYQGQVFHKKVTELPEDFFDNLKVSSTVKKPAPQAKPVAPKQEFDPCMGRRPILVAGAAGSSWDMIPASDQQHIRVCLTMLLQHLDPEKVCFVTGRTKDRGVGIVLGESIEAINTANTGKKEPFPYIMMMAEGGAEPDRFIPRGVSHHLELNVPLVFLPNSILSFIQNRQGVAYFIGGRSFTRDFIVESSRKNIPSGLMQGIKGASSDKGRLLPQKCFFDAADMLRYARSLHPELFL